MAKATKKEDRRRVDVCIPYRSLSLKEFDDYTLDEAIDLSASIGDRMEQKLVTGDDL